MFQLADKQFENIKDTLVITGCPRSGTSILGQLISSLKGIEYHYQPEIVPILMSMIDHRVISKEAAFLLLQIHLHEDLLLESAHGRKANLRPNDMSLILNSIPWAELITRWSTIANTDDAMQYINQNKLRLAIKVLNVMDSIALLSEALPDAQFVIVVRDGKDVVASLLKKRWLTDEALQHNYWPYKMVKGLRIPYRIEDAMAKKWTAMNPVSRACYLWHRDAEFALVAKEGEFKDRIHFIFYEDLRTRPLQCLEDIATFLSTSTTNLTFSLANTVRPLEQKKKSYEFLASVDDEELQKFKRLNEAWGYEV